MAPRGRSRKPRLSRMDAAIDAMSPYGFSEDLVRRTVKGLLKVYDAGDEGWPFLEADAYSVLLETILGEQTETQQEENNQDKCAEGSGGNLLMDVPSQDGVGDNDVSPTAGSSGGAAEPICPEIISSVAETGDMENGLGCLLQAEGDGRGEKDIGLNQTCSQQEIINSASKISNGTNEIIIGANNTLAAHSLPPVISPLPVGRLPTRRRKPHYGWISDSEEEDDYMYITPAIRLQPQPTTTLQPTTTSVQLENLICGAEKRKKRKSRWDEKPDFV